MKKLILLVTFNFILATNIFAQQNQIDSLKQVVSIAKEDTTLVQTLNDLASIYKKINLDTSLIYAEQSLELALQLNYKIGQAKAYKNIGVVYYNHSDYDKTIEYWQKALKTNTEIGNKKGIAANIGIVYYDQSNYPKALEYYQKALKIKEEIGDKKGTASNLGNIGLIYSYQSNYSKALEYYQKALKINEEIGNKTYMAANLGNIGFVYSNQSNYPKALEYYQKALKINEEIGNKLQITSNLGNIGGLYNDLEQYNKTIEYANKALKIAKEIGALSLEKSAYSNLSRAYKSINNYKKALEYKDKWIEINDSIFNTEKAKSIAEMNTRYETEKKEKQIIEQQAELKTSQLQTEKEKAEKEKQQTQRNMFIIAFGLMIILAVFVFRSYRQKKKANLLLAEQKQEISEANEELNQQNEEIIAQRDQIEEQRDIVVKQKDEIEEIHHEISQSIDYATRLQSAILPEEKILDKYLSEHFVLFKPKDKVSGDFYWWSHIENHTIITAADSTGHGVPGAFMSMLGASFLREIVQKEYVTHTGVILRKLRKEIIKALKQTGEAGTQKDGMDMAIISINQETKVVQFSGANNPLYILTNRELVDLKPLEGFENFYEIKPDKMPIAIYEKMDNFTTHEIQLEKGDQLYMFSDGFADQFGGAKGKKFKYKPFKRLLSENRDKPMKEQKELLDSAFETWRDNLEQIDDVVVLGVKI